MLNTAINDKKRLEILNFRRRNKNYVTFRLNIRPKTKKNITTEEMSEYISNMFNHMRKFGYQQFKNNVAIELSISTNDRNTPHIENYIKNIIDLLYESEIVKKRKLSNPENTKFFPLNDDNQIKYLKVKYLSKSKNPTGILKIRLFSSMISDINFLYKKSLLPDRDDYDDDDNNIKEYYSWLNNKESIIERFSEKSFNSMHYLNLQKAQNQILENLKISCNLMYLIYTNKCYSPELRNIFNGYSRYTIDSPFSCVLKELPSRKKCNKEFKENIKKSFEQYIEKNQIFEKLMGPINITAFYKPSNANKSEQKDLDNIMRSYICPIFKQCFKPPTGFYNLEDTQYHKSLKNSILSYEIIEIPKYYNQISKGFLSICFNMIDNVNDKSIFEITDNLIEEYFDNDIRVTRF